MIATNFQIRENTINANQQVMILRIAIPAYGNLKPSVAKQAKVLASMPVEAEIINQGHFKKGDKMYQYKQKILTYISKLWNVMRKSL